MFWGNGETFPKSRGWKGRDGGKLNLVQWSLNIAIYF